VQTIQMYDINSQDRPVATTDHQQNCSITATATTACSTMIAGPERQSFVGGLQKCIHYVEGRQATPARSNKAGDTVSVSMLLVLAVSCR